LFGDDSGYQGSSFEGDDEATDELFDETLLVALTLLAARASRLWFISTGSSQMYRGEGDIATLSAGSRLIPEPIHQSH